MKKKRLDLLLVERGIVPTREKAQRQIMAGNVLVEEVPATKPGVAFADGVQIRLRQAPDAYVSRSAHKLLAGLTAWSDKIVIDGCVGLDLGASTGGFTQVLLERGANQVLAVDVGQNQLDWKIRNHERVRVFEKLHGKDISLQRLGISTPVDLIVADVSFISLTRLVEAMLRVSSEKTWWVTLIKPQFELTPDRVGKGGIVRDDQDRQDAVRRVTESFETHGLVREGLIESPLKGSDGNQEYLALWRIKSRTPEV